MKENKDPNAYNNYLIVGGAGLIAFSLYKKFLLAKFWVIHHHTEAAVIGTMILVPLIFTGCAGLLMWLEPRKKKAKLKAITAYQTDSVLAGQTLSRERVYIPLSARRMHTQIVGTTNAGKTESVILPWAVDDMKNGRGFVLIDGKSDKSLLNKIYAYAAKNKRSKDFRTLSLQDINLSQTFNPLIGGTPEEITERVFNAFEFENSYYRGIQFEVLSQVMRIFKGADVVPTFLRLYEAIRNPAALKSMATTAGDLSLLRWAISFEGLSISDRDQRTSGLLSQMSHFAFGETAKIFNTDKPDIVIEEALLGNQIVYFQLPVLRSPFLGRATGRLVLQALQSAISDRHKSGDEAHQFFSVFLDDFSEYLCPSFVSILNKSRSANVGIVFAHQALGDIEALGREVASSILTNSNLKIIMRGNDPASAEYFAKVIGTKESEKKTERESNSFLGKSRTGESSVRDVEEFVVHPNIIKRSLGVGEALIVIPHNDGSKTVRVKFHKLPDLPTVLIPKPSEKVVMGLDLDALNEKSKSNKGDELFNALKERSSKMKEVS